MTQRPKYTHLLEDRDLKRWHDNLAAESVVTAEVYLRALGLYCELEKTTPKQILRQAKTKKFQNDFADFVRRLEAEKKAGSYIQRFRKVVTNSVNYNGRDVGRIAPDLKRLISHG